MIYFLDTSALVKRYLSEPGSAEVRSLFRRQRPIAVARIASAELAAAVARQHREGAVTEAIRDAILARLNRDFAQMTVVEVRAAMLSRVPGLVVRWPLRGYDAVQLAAALTLQAIGIATTFWSSDANLVGAARGEGLRATVLS
jgi:predicted nucleic acid-binding protein